MQRGLSPGLSTLHPTEFLFHSQAFRLCYRTDTSKSKLLVFEKGKSAFAKCPAGIYAALASSLPRAEGAWSPQPSTAPKRPCGARHARVAHGGDLPSLLCLPLGRWGFWSLGFGLSGVGRSKLRAGPAGVVSVGEGASRAGCFPGARQRPRCLDSVTCCPCSVRSSNSRFCRDSINTTGTRAGTPAPPQAGLSGRPTPAGGCEARPPRLDLHTAVFLLPRPPAAPSALSA